MEILKREKQKDRQAKRALKEILLSLAFVVLTFTCAYQLLDKASFDYQNNLKNLLGAGDLSTSFLDVIIFNRK